MHYAKLVQSVAHRVAATLPTHVDVDDLEQSGVFGLVAAIERFDPELCPRFESYAAQRIRGAILDDLRAQDWVPRTVRGRLRDLERAQERLEGSLLRAATEQELSAELGVPVREVRAHARSAGLASVEAMDGPAGGVAELLADYDADPMVLIQAREMSRQLGVAVARLAERDRVVIGLYYLENRTLAEIGKVLGLTESRVCQLHSRAVVRLRATLAELAVG